MNIAIFEEITTEEALLALEADGIKYTGLYCDMDNAKERKYVKESAALIAGLIKKVDRARIDKAAEYKVSVEGQAKIITERLQTANKPFSLLIDAHKEKRAAELAAEKAEQEAQALRIQIEADHNEAIMLDRFRAIEFADLEKERIDNENRIKAEAAEEANDAKSQFLSTMSHEIRTPMNGMLGMIQLLQGSELSASQHEHIRVLHDATDALLETFDHVLQYGRLVEGAYVTRQTPFALHELLRDLITLMTPIADNKQLTLTLDYSPETSDLYVGAAGSLRQILTNLIANAIKFTDSGFVQLSVRCQACKDHMQQLRFEVRDSGIGIAPELQEHIFDRFTQADATITRRFGGTGLGLAICKELATALEGEIGLTSTPGSGSQFWLELPLAVGQQQRRAESETVDEISPPQQILLVEDVEINQQVVVGLLQQQRHQITIAADGHQALDLSHKQRFDLILMDMHLPGISGLDISKQIKADKNCINQSTPIIALTASVRPEDIHRYLNAGLNSVIAKPVKKAQLLQAVASKGNPAEPPSLDAAKPQTLFLDNSILDAHRQVLGEAKLNELMAGFCAVHADLWPALQRSVAAKDRYEIAQTAHKFAGACDTMGFAQASQLLRVLEIAAESGEMDNTDRVRDELNRVMAQTVRTAREWGVS